MRRRNLVNGALLGATLILGLLAWWPVRDDERGARLTRLNPSDVETLSLEYLTSSPSGGERKADDGRPVLTLERREDGWHITRPIERPARDGRIVTAIAVLSARTPSCYSVGERDLAEFGLTTPRLILRAGDVILGFGDRAADGRRYVRAGERLCLTEDHSYPLLARGLDGLATPSLLAGDSAPLRIETPRVAAARPNAAAEWVLERGGGDARSEDLRNWAARWQAARAHSFVLEPPDTDHGRVRIETADGRVHQWRIARLPPDPVLVPDGADYGLTIATTHGEALLRAPANGSRRE